ncbi:MAG: helix-hairpin-helix domain-containing protein [Desulfobacterales bacterium]|nr:helix-hairpin-helix domain-containing protein [Desulfobacterales bacterium]
MQHLRRILTVCLLSLIVASGIYAGDVGKININTATAEQLTQLKGIGASHADAIVAYREKNGPFQKPEDLIKVPRIGQKTFEKNKELIAVQEPKRRQAKK